MTADQADQWWACAPGVEVTVPCSGGTHRLRWERGVLIASDHPDPDAERAFAALGAGTPWCLRISTAWAAYGHDLRVLTLGARDQFDSPAISAADIQSLRTQVLRPSSTQLQPTGLPAGLPRYFDLDDEDHWPTWIGALELLTLPAPLQVRLALGVAASWVKHLRDDVSAPPVPGSLIVTRRELERSAPALLSALFDGALVGRGRRAVRRWAGNPHAAVRVRTAPSDAGASVAPSARGHIDVALPHRWLATVWGKGISVVDGHLVRAATPTSSSAADAVAVRPPVEGEPPQPIRGTVTLDGDGRPTLTT